MKTNKNLHGQTEFSKITRSVAVKKGKFNFYVKNKLESTCYKYNNTARSRRTFCYNNTEPNAKIRRPGSAAACTAGLAVSDSMDRFVYTHGNIVLPHIHENR